MRPVTTILAMAGILLLVLPGRPAAQARATLRASIELVTVDLVVRDQSGAPVGGLAQEDFEVREDGVPQRVTMFEAPGGGRPGPGDPALPRTITATAAAADAAQVATPSLGAMIFVFDLAAMRPDEVDRAVDAAARYVEQAPAGGLLFGVATIGADLEWLAGLTLDRDAIAEALVDVSPVSGFAAESPEPRTLATDERAAFRIDDGEGRGDEAGAMAAGPDDLAVLTNDRRLRALTRLARSLESVGRKKAVLYFSGGLATSGLDNGVEIRAAVNAAVRANVAFYPVDAAGLRTVTPGGDVTRSPPSDVGLFSGGDVRRQYDDLARAQETLLTLAADTGGRAVLDTNDFRGAFTRAAEDLSTYYLLGYQSTNPARDGRFRRLQVRVRRPGLRVEARAGYYTDLDFAHATRADREAQLAAELAAPMPSTDLPVIVGAAWYRLSAEEYDVPLAVAVPGWEVAAPAGAAVIPLDVLGEIRDEDDRPVGRLRQTASIPLAGPLKLADVLLVYRTPLRLPAGTLHAEARRARERGRPPRIVRDAPRRARPRAPAARGECRRAAGRRRRGSGRPLAAAPDARRRARSGPPLLRGGVRSRRRAEPARERAGRADLLSRRPSGPRDAARRAVRFRRGSPRAADHDRVAAGRPAGWCPHVSGQRD